jgi:hypothetical protein
MHDRGTDDVAEYALATACLASDHEETAQVFQTINRFDGASPGALTDGGIGVSALCQERRGGSRGPTAHSQAPFLDGSDTRSTEPCEQEQCSNMTCASNSVGLMPSANAWSAFQETASCHHDPVAERSHSSHAARIVIEAKAMHDVSETLQIEATEDQNEQSPAVPTHLQTAIQPHVGGAHMTMSPPVLTAQQQDYSPLSEEAAIRQGATELHATSTTPHDDQAPPSHHDDDSNTSTTGQHMSSASSVLGAITSGVHPSSMRTDLCMEELLAAGLSMNALAAAGLPSCDAHLADCGPDVRRLMRFLLLHDVSVRVAWPIA